jgi:hypothetical protein
LNKKLPSTSPILLVQSISEENKFGKNGIKKKKWGDASLLIYT